MKMSNRVASTLPTVAEVLATARRLSTYETMRKAQSLPTATTLRNHGLVEDVDLAWGYSEGEAETVVGEIVYVGIVWRG